MMVPDSTGRGRGDKPRLLALAATVLLGALVVGCGGLPEVKEDPPIVYPPPPDEPRFWTERSLRGSGDAVPLSDEDRLKVLLTGYVASRGSGFSKPYDVHVADGRVLVSDTVARRVFVLDFKNRDFFEIGIQDGPGKLSKPLGIATDQAGNVYVADTTTQRVVVYDRAGNFLRVIGGREQFDRPVGLEVLPDGSRLYVVDIGGVDSDRHRVAVLDPRSGEHLFDIGKRGAGEGEFNLPRDVTLGKDGLLYVSDGGNFRVQVFTPEGRFVRQWGQAGTGFGNFARPKGIAVDPQGNVYVVDTAFSNLQIFNPEGKLLLFIGSSAGGGKTGSLALPAGIDVDDDGRIYVVDQFYAKVDVFRPHGLEPWDGLIPSKPKPRN